MSTNPKTCPDCSEAPIPNNRKRCERCSILHAGRKTMEYRRAAQARLRIRRRESGVCVACASPVVPGRQRCESCLAECRARAKANYVKTKAERYENAKAWRAENPEAWAAIRQRSRAKATAKRAAQKQAEAGHEPSTSR